VFGWPDPNTGFDQSEHALYTSYFIIDIDNRLKFNEHVSNVCTKASQRVGVLMRMKNMIPTRAKLQLYKAAILPYLTYSHTVWHFCCAIATKGN
jgi:hypothetical protein